MRKTEKNHYPPSAKSIKLLFDKANNSPLTDYGYSKNERSVRELESVSISEANLAAVDWTFAPVKNCNLPGKKNAMFTMNKGEYNSYNRKRIQCKHSPFVF